MYLKRLEAMGFKSFADRTVIDFEEGITAIVGPNGTGKSNISDAVRWVLGEQSAKSLRGGNMADVIFNGTTNRKPLNVAEVTLVLDNSDNSLPVDYDEVSITRRVFRSGGGEYLINKQKVRLRDVRELIMDSGIGSDSLSIVSQDKVKAVVEAKPEDRRFFIEEAAGVLKYKNRKREAVRKLQRTDDNLLRVADIINEIEDQIEPLKKEADRAKIYLDKRKELKSVEVALLATEIENMDNTLHTLSDEISEINFEIINMNKTYTDNENRMTQLREEFTRNEEKVTQAQNLVTEVVREVSLIEGKKQAILDKYPNEEDIQKVLEDRLKEYDDKVNELRENRKSIPQLKEKKGELQSQLNNYHIDLNGIISEKNQLTSKIKVLNDFSGNYYQGVAAIVEATRNRVLRGIEGPLAELIEVEDTYSFAIEIALGAALQHIVTETDEDARNAINHLKNNRKGRATFLPINVMKSRNISGDVFNKVRNHDSYIDIASNLISYDKKYEKVVKNLLGHVIIAKDLDGANKISKLANNFYRVVTLDGDVVHVGGSMTGGRTSRNRSSILRQKIELDEAVVRVNELKHLENKVNLEIDNINDIISKVSDEMYNLQLNIARLEEWITHNKGEISILREGDNSEDIIRLQQRRTELEEHLRNTRTRSYNIQQTISDIEKENRELFNIFTKKESEITNKEVVKTRCEVRIEECLDRLSNEYQITYEAAKEEYTLEMEEDVAKKHVNTLRRSISAMGAVNIGAVEQYERLSNRYNFLIEQRDDLLNAKNTLLETISELDVVMVEKFKETFEQVNIEFGKAFKKLFNGGYAELQLNDSTDLLNTGIEIVAQPPGTNLSNSNLLSGGQKSLTSLSLLFAVIKVSTVPFSVLDEVEAALDEANVLRFADYLHIFSNDTQFIVITHRKGTMEKADSLYGVTMQESGVTSLVSVHFEETDEYLESA